LGFKLGNVRVVKTARHIIIHPGKLRDFDANQLLVTAGQIVGRVRLELMGRFGMVLSEEGVALHDPVWEVFTPEAEALNGAGTFKVHMSEGATGGLDNSPPDRKRHFEYNRNELAVAAVRSPELFVELAHKVEILIQTVNGLVTVNEKLVGLLTESLGLALEMAKKLSRLELEVVAMYANFGFEFALMAVETCSRAISSLCPGHGKSSCFSGVAFLWLVSPDYQVSISPCVDRAENLG
jgi:hypothetical protein